jgi:hypothetical protein
MKLKIIHGIAALAAALAWTAGVIVLVERALAS